MVTFGTARRSARRPLDRHADGLVRLLDAKFTRSLLESGLPSNVIDALCEDHDGSLLWQPLPESCALARASSPLPGEFPKDGVGLCLQIEKVRSGLVRPRVWPAYKDGAIAKYTRRMPGHNSVVRSIRTRTAACGSARLTA